MSSLLNMFNVYASSTKYVENSAPVNDWFHPSGTRWKKTKKSTNHKSKKSEKYLFINIYQ